MAVVTTAVAATATTAAVSVGTLTTLSGMVGFTVTVQGLLTAASMAYQILQAKKMRRDARAAAEARKGFELVAEGEIRTIPIIYGRALVGGVRVYHNVSSSYKHATSNASKSLLTGPNGEPAGSYEVPDTESSTGGIVTYAATDAEYLNKDINGSKNEFLYLQQVLCQGPIHAVHDVIIDDAQYIDDPSLGNTDTGSVIYKMGKFDNNDNPKAAMRLDFHYNGGYNSVVTANFGERKTAGFPDLAYLSAIIRLDRDEPQFSKVPNIQSFIEGRLVRCFSSPGVLSTSKVYSNNPALCLLDYLMDETCGKGLDPTQDIDLDSFYKASLVCDTQVQTVQVAGKIWQPTDASRSVTSRSLPLYECNIIVDVSKPVRENVEAILATMGDARLVWSEGKYKLRLQYPLTNAGIELAAVLTDDDLVHDKTVEITWPTASERLNNCTVRFNNEAENFKEDSVNWPPKSSSSRKIGVGGKRYLAVSGWNSDNIGGRFLNNYAVWDGGSETTTITWKLVGEETGTHSLSFTADDEITIRVYQGATELYSGYRKDYKGVSTTTLFLTKDEEYSIVINGANPGESFKGVAATLTTPSGVTSWTTRSETYSYFNLVNVSDAIYNEMLAEDSEIKLETDIFAEGITDYYHALAKAEELVRTSRTASGIKFQYVIKDTYLEPGDIIRLESETLSLGITQDLYIKINEVKVLENAICEITGIRFDYTQLAWAMKDDEYVTPPNLYAFEITPPTSLTYTPEINLLQGSPGTLSWPAVPEAIVKGYVLYFHLSGDLNSAGRPTFKEIGRATQSPFFVPDLGDVTGIFGVAAAFGNQVSSITTTDPNVAISLYNSIKPPKPAAPTLALYGDFNTGVKVSWAIPTTRPDTTAYQDHASTLIFRAKAVTAPDEPVYFQIGTDIAGTEFVDSTPEFGDNLYKIQFKSKRNLLGVGSDPSSITIDTTSAVNYDVEIESTNGNIFRVGLGRTTTLIAHVYENTIEVTDILPKYRFKWRRVSSDPVADVLWNDLYAPNKENNVGYKQIEISVDEVNASATFHCDILSD